MLGMSLSTFTVFHVIISLLGMATGLVVIAATIQDRWVPAWTAAFLFTTIATSVTGFMFPLTSFGPPEILGVISLVVLAIAVVALYVLHLRGAARPAYIISATLALYLNVFVGVVQSFQKIPSLQQLAPTQSEPPFLIAQTVLLLIFLVLGFLALRRFHRMSIQTA